MFLQMVTGLNGHNGALVVRHVEEEIKHTQELALIHNLHMEAPIAVTPILNLKLRTVTRIIVQLVRYLKKYYSHFLLTCLFCFYFK